MESNRIEGGRHLRLPCVIALHLVPEGHCARVASISVDYINKLHQKTKNSRRAEFNKKESLPYMPFPGPIVYSLSLSYSSCPRSRRSSMQSSTSAPVEPIAPKPVPSLGAPRPPNRVNPYPYYLSSHPFRRCEPYTFIPFLAPKCPRDSRARTSLSEQHVARPHSSPYQGRCPKGL